MERREVWEGEQGRGGKCGRGGAGHGRGGREGTLFNKAIRSIRDRSLSWNIKKRRNIPNMRAALFLIMEEMRRQGGRLFWRQATSAAYFVRTQHAHPSSEPVFFCHLLLMV